MHRKVTFHAHRLRSPVSVDNVASNPNSSSLAADLKLPPGRLRIRSPIQRLRLLRPSSQNGLASTIPLWTSQSRSSPHTAVPDIVISRAFSVLPVSPSLTTSSAPSMTSIGNLEVPGAVRTPLVQSNIRSNRPPAIDRQPPKLQAKVNSPTKGGQLVLGHKKKSAMEKENRAPHSDAKPRRMRGIFGSR